MHSWRSSELINFSQAAFKSRFFQKKMLSNWKISSNPAELQHKLFNIWPIFK